MNFLTRIGLATLCGAGWANILQAIPAVNVDAESFRNNALVALKLTHETEYALAEGGYELALFGPNSAKEPLSTKRYCPVLAESEVGISMLGLPDGAYRVAVREFDIAGKPTGQAQTAEFMWSKPAEYSFQPSPETRALNNVVSELKTVKNPTGAVEFVNPKDGWVFVSAEFTGFPLEKVNLAFDGIPGQPVEARPVTQKGQFTVEAMRRLPAGKHRVEVTSPETDVSLRQLTVRAIPEMLYVEFESMPTITEFGPYDWNFLKKHVLPHINVLTTLERTHKPHCASMEITQAYREYFQDWVGQGREWLFCLGMPGSGGPEDEAVERIKNGLYNFSGLHNRFSSGLLIDEFAGAENDLKVNYNAWSRALDELYQSPGMENRRLYAYSYSTPMVLEESAKRFAETVMRHNGKIDLEWYPPETGLSFWVYRDQLKDWRAGLPDSPAHLIANMGTSSNNEPFVGNIDPAVDSKVFMDLFLNTLVNDPAFHGLGGFSWYAAAGSDEELVRWGHQLFRHYCIEGNTDLLSNRYGFRYRLNHLANPDFADGLNAWSIEEAAPGSITAGKLEGLGTLEGRRLDRIDAAGDDYFSFTRHADAPNVISQTVNHLVPGRLYSVKLLSADLQALNEGISRHEKFGISVTLEGVEVLEEKSFQQVFSPNFDRRGLRKYFPKFNTYSPAWLNLHYVVFRALSDQAQLSISDWVDGAPAGAIGQQLIGNFVELQPYFGE